MASKISIIAIALLLVNVHAQQYGQQVGRRSQDRLNQLRSYDDGARPSRNYNDQYNDQRYLGRNQDQDLQDRRERDEYDRDDYSYGYAVRDELSGDIKSQQETRNGDRVRGQYRTLESDGTERIVDYTADDIRGFNAVVRHQPSVGSRAQIVHTLQPAVLIRQPQSVGTLASGNNRPALLTTPQQASTVLLRN
ncbi:cuticle protein 19.8-like [Anopheles maculipalpis]|uniref:cuticle protein 19.8-like n=1 Tax=Anopheles maculipalpis TaxID=1496333 RepID=UPI00215929FE|nr:cuticle protein 19.8-like [Anopheles maculipalpis]